MFIKDDICYADKNLKLCPVKYGNNQEVGKHIFKNLEDINSRKKN